MVTLFGTDGVRGLVNSTLMPELAYQLGRAAGAYFCKTSGKHRFLIGMDTRISGSMLTAALSAGLCASGVDVDLALLAVLGGDEHHAVGSARAVDGRG